MLPSTVVLVKSPEEGLGTPTKEGTIEGLKAARQILDLMEGQSLPPSDVLEEECHFIAKESTAILDRIHDVGNGDIAPWVVGLSLSAQLTSVATFVVNPGLVYAYGLSGLLGFGVAAAGGITLGLLLFSKAFRRVGARVGVERLFPATDGTIEFQTRLAGNDLVIPLHQESHRTGKPGRQAHQVIRIRAVVTHQTQHRDADAVVGRRHRQTHHRAHG